MKLAARLVGLEVRYAFQYPSASGGAVIRKWLGGDGPDIVFDVGANVGQTATAILADFPKARVYSFEPFPAAFTKLAIAAKRAGRSFSAFNLACGEENTTLKVRADPSSDSQLNRLVGSESARTELPLVRIEVVRLDAFCLQQGISNIDVLKTDTEGYDLSVLKGAQGLLAAGKIKCVIAEIGFLGDTWHSPFSGIYDYLSSHGFEIAGVYDLSYRQDGAVDFGNAIFVLPHPTAAGRSAIAVPV